MVNRGGGSEEPAFASYGAAAFARAKTGGVRSPPSQPPSHATARHEHGAAAFARAKTGGGEKPAFACYSAAVLLRRRLG